MTHHVAILIFDNIEVLDYAGPYQVFTTASRVYGHTNPQAEPPFSVQCVARDATPVKELALRTARQMDYAWQQTP